VTTNSDNTKINIGLLPYELEANQYIEKNRKILERIGKVLPVPNPKKLLAIALQSFFRSGRFKLYDVLIINWRENALKNERNRLHLIGIFEYFFSLSLHKLVSRKLIYVKHNSHPHNLPPKQIRFAQKLTALGQLWSDSVVIHSPVKKLLGKNIVYIPHPLYDVYPQSQFETTTLNNQEFLMFGRVQPYKKLDEVISNWEGPSKLIILGPCSDQDYLAKLKELAKGKNIAFEIAFHPETYLEERVGRCAGVIITNDNESMLVSGSFFFAISCGAPLYVKTSPFFEWVKTTSLDPYLKTAETIPKLINAINECHQLITTRSKKTIREEAEKYFGDDSVEKAWRHMLD
jgi:glycosyltransferase involved in cell wall biosynthesis